jgi:hypothetical protein
LLVPFQQTHQFADAAECGHPDQASEPEHPKSGAESKSATPMPRQRRMQIDSSSTATTFTWQPQLNL